MLHHEARATERDHETERNHEARRIIVLLLLILGPRFCWRERQEAKSTFLGPAEKPAALESGIQ